MHFKHTVSHIEGAAVGVKLAPANFKPDNFNLINLTEITKNDLILNSTPENRL